MEHIKVICKEFVSQFRSTDVSSLMYKRDGTPIIGKTFSGKDYHLGQISSSFEWAKHDIQDHFKDTLDEMFPDGYEFDFKFERLGSN